MWTSRVNKRTDKSGAMKKMQEHIQVLYFASDCAEPYVEVRLLHNGRRWRGIIWYQALRGFYHSSIPVRYCDDEKNEGFSSLQDWFKRQMLSYMGQICIFPGWNANIRQRNMSGKQQFSHPFVTSSPQIITVKDSKRRLSLCSSVESEVDEREYQEVEDDFPVLSHESQLLDEYHLQKVSFTPQNCPTLVEKNTFI